VTNLFDDCDENGFGVRSFLQTLAGAANSV